MEHGFKWLNNITDRIFNKYTPKGIGAVVVALLLQHLGASDDVIKIAMSFEWTFITDILVLLKEYKVFLEWMSIILLMIGGFFILKRNHSVIQLRTLEIEAKAMKKEAEKKRTEIELAKLECELKSLSCSLISDENLHKQLNEARMILELSNISIKQALNDIELQKISKKR